jgi:hypothetical protein
MCVILKISAFSAVKLLAIFLWIQIGQTSLKMLYFAGVTGLKVGGAIQKLSPAPSGTFPHPWARPNSTRFPSVATEGEGRAQAPAAGMGGDGFTMSISSRHVRIHSYSILGKKSRP